MSLSSSIFTWMQRPNEAIRRLVLHHILHIDDSPHRLALGAALGMFVAFTPTVGFQMLIVLLLAWLLRANKIAGVPLVWISNPLTIPPIFYSGYTLGRLLLGRKPLDQTWWAALATPPESWLDATRFYWSRSVEIAWPLWIGCILIGIFMALPTYSIVLSVATKHRKEAA